MSIGYQRRRALLGTQFEGTLTSILLLVGGIVLVLFFVSTILRWLSVL